MEFRLLGGLQVLDDAGQSARAVFVIDPQGIVRHEVVHDDRVGRSVNEILRVIDSLQAPGRTFAEFDISRLPLRCSMEPAPA